MNFFADSEVDLCSLNILEERSEGWRLWSLWNLCQKIAWTYVALISKEDGESVRRKLLILYIMLRWIQ